MASVDIHNGARAVAPPPHANQPPHFDGGSAVDQQAVLHVHHRWCAALDALDNDALREIWSSDTRDCFFNANGLTYYGADDWAVHAWDYYRPMFRLLEPYGPGRVKVVIRGDMAYVAADWVRRTKEWLGQPEAAAYNIPYYRISQVCVRDDGGAWIVRHAHLSEQSTSPRPDELESPGSAYRRLDPRLIPGVRDLATHPDKVGSARVDEPPLFDGGSEADQQALYEIHHKWCSANDWLDDDALRRIWSNAPDSLMLNTNGQTYHGVEDWLAHAWAYYRERMQFARPYTPGNVQVVVRGDMGYVIADMVGRNKKWIGPEAEQVINRPFYRTTQVCTREDGVWTVAHVHFSIQSTDPRPDGSAPPH